MAAPATANVKVLHRGVTQITLTATANFSYVFQAPHGLSGMSLQSDGNDGGGTLVIQGSNDGVTFAALPTAVSLTAAGIASIAVADLGYCYYQVDLSGSTGPTLTCWVGMNVRV